MFNVTVEGEGYNRLKLVFASMERATLFVSFVFGNAEGVYNVKIERRVEDDSREADADSDRD